MAETLTCDKSLTTVFPCLQCLSEQELLTAIAIAWAVANNADITTEDGLRTALEGSACLECLSDKELLQAEAAILLNYFITTPTDSFTASTSALSRQTKHRLRALIVWYMCQYFVPVL